ncbi:MAG: hypothetical protein P4L40_10430 [Terracidiphilus sp.]|nr:hypothetical protein [Terracidiphilus sp.]
MAAQPMIRRIFGRSLMDMALLAMVAFIMSDLRVPAKMFTDPDIWWHMACARIVDQTHHFIHLEPFSFTVAGQSWIDPEWLSSTFYWLGFKWFGHLGVYAVMAAGICGNVLLIYWRSRWRSKSAAVSFWVSVVAVLLMTVNASARTILFGYLALSAEMAILYWTEHGRHRLLWLLPPLFIVWINMHGSWIFGIAVLVLYIVCGWFRVEYGIFHQEALTREERTRLLYVLGASVAALFVNPYGWRLLWNPFDMAFAQSVNLGNVSEWQPLNLGWFVGKVSALIIAGLIAAHAVKGRTWKLYELPLVFFAWYEAFAHTRFTFLAAVLTLPIVASDLSRVFFPPPTEQKTIPAMNAIIAVCAVLVIAHFIPSESKLKEAVAKELPIQTVTALRPEWRTFNIDDIGGLMDFYGKPSFVDTRWDTFDHHGVMKDFVDALHIKDSLEMLKKYNIDHVLMRDDDPLTYLLEHSGGWREMRRERTDDHEYVLLERVATPH